MALPFQWRVTKYDPARRDEQGYYLPDDWTFFAQVGQVIGGRQLTHQDYLRVESAYVGTALRFMAEAGLTGLEVVDLQTHGQAHEDYLQGISLLPSSLKPGALVGGGALEGLIRLNLREALWCKLEAPNAFYLHFGWDYYMYIGSISPSPQAIGFARGSGLFVEEKPSPHLGGPGGGVSGSRLSGAV